MDFTYLKCNTFRIYNDLRQFARKIIKGSGVENFDKKFVSFKDYDFDSNGRLKAQGEIFEGYINELPFGKPISKVQVYPVENFVTDDGVRKHFIVSFKEKSNLKAKYCSEIEEAAEIWPKFIEASKMPKGYKNGGLLYTGFINEYQQWCLPSWIWTNASSIRYFCRSNQVDKAEFLGNKLLSLQNFRGGWIVRYDFESEGIKPLLAPNDSAYIANNAFVSLYKATNEPKYLKAAVQCADWIMNSARPDGMVYFGYDDFRNNWETDHNIVDVGFTAGLFAELYGITKDNRYLFYLKKFTDAYIRLFYDPELKWFLSSLDNDDKARGCGFSRGQAWALEGLIPAYCVLKDAKIKTIIEDTISSVIAKQNADGSWANDVGHPDLGADCKGTPIIAYSLQKWLLLNPNIRVNIHNRIQTSVDKAMKWCACHTIKNGLGAGGIFSYCYVGAIVHHRCTSTAFVYSCAYALELLDMQNSNIGP